VRLIKSYNIRDTMRAAGALLLVSVTAVTIGAFIFVVSEPIGHYDCPLATEKTVAIDCKRAEVAKAINDARGSLIQIVAGIAGAFVLYFTWQTYALGREGRASDNFIKAVDQLGNSAVPVQVGGLYGLGRLLRTADKDRDYFPILDVICSFVRKSHAAGDTPRSGRCPEDLYAAVNILARRSIIIYQREDDSPVDLNGTDLSEAWMSGGHYESAYMTGSQLVNTNLSGAFLDYAESMRRTLPKPILVVPRCDRQSSGISGKHRARASEEPT
jgi:hypothetical protein